jgi:radical SAM superfamily enzyme YgiQ (UPF0313 family)
MKILLINPPQRNIITTTQAKFIVSERGLSPPLGLLYLASTLKKKTDYDIKIIDCQLYKLTDEQIKTEILSHNPDVVGITVITFMLIDSIHVAGMVKECGKKLGKKIHVVAGGPHVTIYPEETAKLESIDFALSGEAEFNFLSLVDNIENHDILKNIPGICYLRNGTLFKGRPPDFIQDLNSIPMPDRRLLDYKRYFNILSGSGIMTTIMSSRGCPYRCIFCERLGKKFRPVSPGNVIKEIEDCLSLGINEIFLHDDTFTIDKKRVMDICSLIKEKSLKFKYFLRSRVNTIDEEMIKALKETGCQRISFGVESGVQRILDRIKKGITLEQAEMAFRLTRKYKITSLADFMIGHPDETIEDIHQTIKFAKKINPDYIQFSITTPYPATDLYREALEKGIIKKDLWREFAEHPDPDFVPPRWEQNMDKNMLYSILHQCYRSFYLSPSFIFKNLIKLRGWNESTRKINAGVKLLMNEMLIKAGRNKDGFR